MVLALVAGGVVVEDGLARWVRWQSGRRAPWAASSAALGVAVPDSECVHSQADVIHFIAWLAHELRGTVRLCALDGAVWGRRPWWAVWLVVRRVVVAVDAAVTFGVAVLDGEGVVPKGAVSLWGAWPGGCDLFFSLAAPVLVGSRWVSVSGRRRAAKPRREGGRGRRRGRRRRRRRRMRRRRRRRGRGRVGGVECGRWWSHCGCVWTLCREGGCDTPRGRALGSGHGGGRGADATG